MNAEAARLGMGCTRYSSPSGFFDHGNFSCAADLAMLAHVDLAAAPDRAGRRAPTRPCCPFPIKGGKLYLYNNNPLLIYHYPGTTGLKTGYTDRRRPLPRRHRRAPRRAPGRRGPALHRTGHARPAQLLDRGFEDVYHLPPVAEPPMPPGA